LLLWLVICRAASLFDSHGLRVEATRISFMIASGILLLQGLVYKYGLLQFKNNIVLNGRFLWYFPHEICKKYPFHFKHTFELWPFALCS
jgi:hypothetical protein